MRKERPHSRDAESQETLRAAYAAPRGTGSLPVQRSSQDDEVYLSPGWSFWLAWVFGLLGFFLAATAWMFLGLALLTPLVVNQTLLTAVLLGPVIGSAVALPGVVCALLAARRGRSVGASITLPITLVSLSTVILIGGLLFGGLVSYPRAQLGTFALAIQDHCARLAQSLQPYGNPPEMSKLQQNPLEVVALLRNDEAALPGDQAALNALTTPDPTYQPLLDDCRSLAGKDRQVTSQLQSELVALPPDLSAAQKTLAQYQTDTAGMLAQIQQLGSALKQQVYAPFQPG